MLPAVALETSKRGGVMRSGRDQGGWKQSLEKLREQWSEFTYGIFAGIAEEEMRIRREELEDQAGPHGLPRAPWESAQKRGG
jgi:hypothetical protein